CRHTLRLPPVCSSNSSHPQSPLPSLAPLFRSTAAPPAAAERRTASATAPMPPSGNPQLPMCPSPTSPIEWWAGRAGHRLRHGPRSEEHTSELQSRVELVCRLLLEKKKEG